MSCIVSLTALGGALKVDFPLSCLTSLTFSILGSIISGLTLEAGEKKTTTLFNALEEVLQEERE